jgi:hypothetical protein
MTLSDTIALDWNDGRLVILNAGQTAKCASLVQDQLYAILLYNASQIDVDAAVTVVWSNTVPPSKVTVRGSTDEAAPANFVFVSGSDTEFVSISLSPGSAASVEAFIVSISMPLNTQGLNNAVLPVDGQFHPFEKYDRYYAESAAGWRSVTIENQLTQFICLQMLQSTATIFVINLGSGLAEGQVSKFGPTPNAIGTVEINQISYQSYEAYLQGDGGTFVWMNGDSRQNSANAEIALQELSLTELFLHISGISRMLRLIGKNTMF